MKKSLYIMIFALFSVLVFAFSKSINVEGTNGSVPTINLINSEIIYLKIGTEYIEYGATAIDFEDGNLNNSIQTYDSSLDINNAGTYDITYFVTDSDGNTASKTRQIIVFDTADYIKISEPISFHNDSLYPWVLVNIDGKAAMQSNNKLGNTTSSLSINVNSKAILSFDWKVSSESGYDFLKYYVNGVEQSRISGYKDWETVVIDLDEGDNTVTWQYSKDYSVDVGSNSGFIANVNVIRIDFDDLTTTINGSFNYYDGLKINCNRSEDLDFSINSVDGYDKSYAGYQDINYNIDVFYQGQRIPFNVTRRITVEPIINNIEDGGIYEDNIKVTFDGGIASLNGKDYESGSEIKQIGNNSLIIYGMNDYSKTVNFQVIPSLNDGEVFYDTYTPNINASSMMLNGQPFYNDEITEIGNHTLTINGLNEYTQTIHFQIIPSLNDGEVFYETYSPNINAKSLILNEQAYANEKITNAGNYELTINGVGNYNQTINFTIEPVYRVVEEGRYTGSIIPIISEIDAMYELNGSSYNVGDKITEVGNHTLKVIGENGYIKKIEFTVLEQVINLKNEGVYKYFLAPIISNAILKLDGEDYTSGTMIFTVGEHTLQGYGLNGYTFTYTFTITEQVINLEDSGVYDNFVTPHIPNAQLFLDNENYLSGTEINTIGEHLLTVVGNNYINHYHFTVEPVVNGAEDGKEYFSPIAPNFSGGTLTLNGEEYISGSIISKIGNYSLIISGVNGYIKSINFKISPTIKDLDIITGTFSPNINANSMTLNDQVYQNEEISQIGNYVLIVNGVGNYTEIINFTIEPIFGVIDGKDCVGRAIPVIDGSSASYKINGMDYEIGDFVELGEYSLTVIGENGYNRTINFNVVEHESNLLNDGIYFNSITPTSNLSSYTLKLNGNLIENDIPITRVGYNELTIIGSNGYRTTIKFTLLNNANVVNGKIYTQPLLIEKINAKMFLNGVEITEDTLVNKQGKYKLEIIGVGDYKEIINFEYYNYNYERAGIIALPIIILLGTTLLLFKFRKSVI